MKKLFAAIICLLCVLLTACVEIEIIPAEDEVFSSFSGSLSDIPAYSGEPWAVLNDNIPYFDESMFSASSWETYSELDSLGRCGVAFANIGQDLMPTESREDISKVKPTGWQTIPAPDVDGGYLFNRCHLIGFQLAGENANEKNLITGTRYLNIKGMLPFENLVTDYVKETGHHVLYRVTPIFSGDNLIADGVLMEGQSVEDNGETVMFCVFCYNVQPGYTIDYTGAGSGQAAVQDQNNAEKLYVINTNSGVFHLTGCSAVSRMSENNKKTTVSTYKELSRQYTPCDKCLAG